MAKPGAGYGLVKSNPYGLNVLALGGAYHPAVRLTSNDGVEAPVSHSRGFTHARAADSPSRPTTTTGGLKARAVGGIGGTGGLARRLAKGANRAEILVVIVVVVTGSAAIGMWTFLFL